MTKILIFSAFCDISAIECAIKEVNDGNEVHVIHCDKNMRVCMHNMYGNSIFCNVCHSTMMNAWKECGVYDKLTIKDFSQLLTKEDKQKAKNFKAEFNSVNELKTLTYKGAEVGYGAFSSYVSMTRNVMPDITVELKTFIGFLIQKEIELFEVGEHYIQQYHPNKLIFHNGRFSTYKPFLALAQTLHIDYIVTEHNYSKGTVVANFTKNNVVHEIEPAMKQMRANWEKGKEYEDVEELGKQFYERRRKGVPAGDKVYIKGQKKGLLPEGFDSTKENIVIFNSSEDEFCSISKEFDAYLLFPNQYEALTAIFEHYKNDTTKHFYVRVHPNLKNVPFKSHLKLYELDYPNVTIIRPESPISSYDLMDASSKVIIFDSTMGIESAYWGKPVIALTYFYYSAIDAVHTPKNTEELWSMINNNDLECKFNHDVIKYGYWLYRRNNPEFKYVKWHLCDFKFFGRQIVAATVGKFCGSYSIVLILEILIRKMSKYMPFTAFHKLPCTEPYKLQNNG